MLNEVINDLSYIPRGFSSPNTQKQGLRLTSLLNRSFDSEIRPCKSKTEERLSRVQTSSVFEVVVSEILVIKLCSQMAGAIRSSN